MVQTKGTHFKLARPSLMFMHSQCTWVHSTSILYCLCSIKLTIKLFVYPGSQFFMLNYTWPDRTDVGVFICLPSREKYDTWSVLMWRLHMGICVWVEAKITQSPLPHRKKKQQKKHDFLHLVQIGIATSELESSEIRPHDTIRGAEKFLA